MAPYRFQDVRIIFADPNTEIRQGLKSALRHHGFKRLNMTGNPDHLERAIRGDQVDLIITDIHFEGHSISEQIKSMRNSQLGNNPFPVTIALTNQATSGTIRQCIDAGFDDILVKPLTVSQMIDRIVYLIEWRKPFVVTHDYIGPDRRKRDRTSNPNSNGAPRLIVPNPLKARAKDGLSPSEIQRQIDEGKLEINEQRLLRYDQQIDWLVSRIMPGFLYNRIDDNCLAMMAKLEFMAEDLSKRVAGSSLHHISGLAKSLHEVVKRINGDPTSPSPKDIELLPNLVAAIRAAYQENDDDISIAEDISERVLAAPAAG